MDTVMMTPKDRNRAVDIMLCVGGYEETPEFDRWTQSDEAEPILRAWMIAGKPLPQDGFSRSILRKRIVRTKSGQR